MEDKTSTLAIDIVNKVEEEHAKFIFKTISDWLGTTYQTVVSKKVLVRALQWYKIEHFEEYAALMKEIGVE